jgi:hypothetical protein
MGLSHDGSFARYHQVLNRANWSSLKLSQMLLNLLLRYLASAEGPLVFGIDETLERRRGQRISAKGIYRDAVRSSKSHFVKASGLRWISLMYLAYIPWAQRVWALPVLTALAALLSRTGPGTSEAYRPSPPDDYSAAPLAAPALSGTGG